MGCVCCVVTLSTLCTSHLRWSEVSLRCQPVGRLEESKGRIVGALKEYGAAAQIFSEDTLCFKDTVKKGTMSRKEGEALD